MSNPTTRTVFVALVLLLSTVAGAGPAPAKGTPAPPALAIQTLDGKTFDLAAQRGKWVIVNFWATWCAPCIAEMPEISNYVTSHKDVTAIGLAWDRSPRDEILAFAKKHPVDYPLAQVDMDHPPADFPVQALPTTWLIAPDGRAAKHFIGPIDAEMLDAAIAAAQKRPAAAGPLACYSPVSYCAGPMARPERVSLGRSARRSETTPARSLVVKPADAAPWNRLATDADK